MAEALSLVRKHSTIPAFDPEEVNVFDFHYREIPFAELSMTILLGTGASGSVYKGRWRNALVAIKQITISASNSIQSIRSELQIMTSLGNHPNIIPLIGACTTQQDSIYTVLKFCEKGSLYEYLIEKMTKITNDQLSTILQSSAFALEFLHSKNIVHRDIAARNFLLASPFNDYLADFGLSRLVVSDDGTQQTQTSYGPLRWMAPESIFNKEYSTKSDCYMYAMFLYEVLFRKVPFFETPNILDVTELVAAGERPKILDGDLQPIYLDIFRSCWCSDPADRLTMCEIRIRWINFFQTSSEPFQKDSMQQLPSTTLSTIEVHYGDATDAADAYS